MELVIDDVSHSLILISRALIAKRIAGPTETSLESTIAERMTDERNKRRRTVKDRRLKRLITLEKKKRYNCEQVAVYPGGSYSGGRPVKFASPAGRRSPRG